MRVSITQVSPSFFFTSPSVYRSSAGALFEPVTVYEPTITALLIVCSNFFSSSGCESAGLVAAGVAGRGWAIAVIPIKATMTPKATITPKAHFRLSIRHLRFDPRETLRALRPLHPNTIQEFHPSQDDHSVRNRRRRRWIRIVQIVFRNDLQRRPRLDH